MNSVIELRHAIHRHPERSGEERHTAELISDHLANLNPDALITDLGGYGVAAVFEGPLEGPTVLVRCELDALPIDERNHFDHRSQCPGVSHKCGHDGHMAIVAALAQNLSKNPPRNGRVVLLFQPAEETGEGAAAVVASPDFSSIRPDFAFALHNLPGLPMGEVVVREGSFSCASRGMSIRLDGKSAHAAQPETGRSPADALCEIIAGLKDLNADHLGVDEIAFTTVVGARLGDKAFGTAPAQAEIWATLRSETDPGMRLIVKRAESLARRVADRHSLALQIHYQDVFPATHCDPAAIAMVRAAASPLPLRELEQPMRWSEDFGHVTKACSGALFGLGAGEQTPALHDSSYDFPDQLIEPAAALFRRIIDHAISDRCTSADEVPD